MNEQLKLAAEVINTNWCYFLDMDGEDSDIYIHFFRREDWFNNSVKIKPTASDIMRYRIIFPTDKLISPPNSDWDDLFKQGCLYSEESKSKVEEILDDWGFIDISKVKVISEEEERLLMMA